MERKDSLDRNYKPINQMNTAINVLFWTSLIFSLILISFTFKSRTYELLTVVFIIIAILHATLFVFLKVYLIPRTENERRKHLLSVSFGIHLNNEETNNYYNNNLEPSLKKLGANLFENSLFATRVTTKMANIERCKIFIYLIVWLTLVLWRDTQLNFILITAQTLFTTSMLTNYFYLEFLRSENEKIFNDLYTLFMTLNKTDQNSIMPVVLDNFVRYESAKAYSGIKQSSKIFTEINGEVSEEWEEIKHKLNIQ